MKNDDYAAAEVAFKRALELSPNYATAHQWYGTTLGNMGREEEGLAQKRRALELDPLSPIVNMSLGMTLRGLGQFDEALLRYETAIESDPTSPGAYERIGELYRYVYTQFDEAVKWQRKGIALDPSEPWGSMFLGFIYLDLGDSQEAERWFKRAGEQVPNPVFARMMMEPVYMYRGDETKALEIARETLAMNPYATQTLTHVRNHEFRAGRYDEGARSF